MPAISTVLLDLDGVLRHFDPEHRPAVEARHGLADGALAAAGLAPALLTALVTGRITRAQWTAEVGRAVANPAAAEEWLADRGTIDSAMMTLVDELRRLGLQVAVLTNGTDTIDAELRQLGVADRFDAVFSTADIGAAKPDPRAFAHVCTHLGVRPATVFFTDDSADKLAGADELGMSSRLFVGVADCRSALADLGLAVAPMV